MQSYQDRFNEVIKHIHFHLDEKLDLDKLANIALVSKYHFHRMIKTYLGEPLGTYVYRIRIEKGAKLLKYSDHSISEIAYKVGYETPTSFTKGFNKQFGVSPSHYRKNPNHSFDIVKEESRKTNFKLAESKEMIDSFLILCHQSKGVIGSPETKKVWDELMMFAGRNNLIKPRIKLYGMHWDDPSITEKQNLRYDACFSIDSPIPNDRFVVKHIEGGKYLCFTYKGDYKYLGDVYHQIFRDYILTKNVVLREEPLFEQYLKDMRITPPHELLTKIFIPIKA